MPRSSKWSVSIRLPYQNFVCISVEMNGSVTEFYDKHTFLSGLFNDIICRCTTWNGRMIDERARIWKKMVADISK
jgi:hypothetical protein